MASLTSEDFLRRKTTVVYDHETDAVDVATGEILRQERETVKRTSTEPDYIKVYYKAMMAVNGIAEIPLDFLLALSAQIGFSNGDRVMFYNNKTTRRAISDQCGIGDNMTSKYIRRCVSCGILFATQDRGTYEVNPWLIAKGKWEHIKELQASFEFVGGKWKRIITSRPEDAEEEESKPRQAESPQMNINDFPEYLPEAK